MKIECTTGEFESLQGNAEKQELFTRVGTLSAQLTEARDLAWRNKDEQYSLRETIRRLEHELHLAKQAPPVPLPDRHVFSESQLLKLGEVFAALQRGEKIEAIKQIRMVTNCGLKEAKDIVEGNFPSTLGKPVW